MANISLPNGSTIGVSSGVGSSKAVQGISNANPAVVSATGHGFANGDYVVMTSGWAKLDSRVVRVANISADTFELEGVDTTSTTSYPAGGGAGSAAKANATTQITGIFGATSSGGDQQYWTGAPLESDHQIRIPTTKNAAGIDFDVADDPGAAFAPVLQAANDDREARVVVVTLSNGGILLYNAYISMGTIPTLTRDQPMSNKVTLSLLAEPSRYAS